MKILQLHNYTQDTTGYATAEAWMELNNPETDCQRYAWEAFNQSGEHEVIVGSLTPGRSLRSVRRGHTEYVFFPAILPGVQLGKLGQFSPRVWEYIRQARVERVVFHSIYGVFNFLLARRLRQALIPYAIYFHWRQKKARFDVLSNYFQRTIIRNADTLMVQTALLGTYLTSVYGVKPERVRVIPMGIRTDLFQKRPVPSPYPYPRLLTVARIVRNKGVLEAVQCLEQVRREFPEAVLEIAGPEQDPVYARSVKEYVREHKLEGAVVFSGQVDNRALPEKYNSADLMVFPSQQEGLAKAVIESMACEVPVVALRGSGGPEEIIRPGVDGWLVSPGELNTKVLEILRDRVALKTMGTAGRERVLEAYSFERHLALQNQLYGRAQTPESGERP